MKERPILFSGPMVRAILDGCKTQTRRVVKVGGSDFIDFIDGVPYINENAGDGCFRSPLLEYCPYGVPGDRLWVRETHCAKNPSGRGGPVGYAADGVCGYVDASGGFCPHGRIIEAPGYRECFPPAGARTFGIAAYGGKWRPSIHMPRWASRLTLEVVSVRVDRLRGISENDALAEGYLGGRGDLNAAGAEILATRVEQFSRSWNALNAKRGYGWDANPWVWVIEFKRLAEVHP